MHVFVTGATGWVGATVVEDLIGAGHQVTGLARSPEKAEKIAALGAQVLLGDLDELDKLREAAGGADAVVHTAFNHDFSKFAENSAQDRRAIEALGEALEGSDRPLLVTSGVALLTPGRLVLESDRVPADAAIPRRSEAAAEALAERGLKAACVRLPPTVHGAGDHGFVPMLIDIARQSGVSAYIGDGSHRWAATHRTDAAKVYRLALEHGVDQGAYHAIAEEGIPFREIAQAIGKGLGLPVESRPPEHFGWFAGFAGMDMQASSEQTRELLGWTPTGPTLLADMAANYF